MTYRYLPLSSIVVNKANDRHGELENETAATAWLFNNRETHMRNLARDIVRVGGIYEPPLVYPDGDSYVVFDGNRRVTCFKILENPRRAPTVELRKFFEELRGQWPGAVPDKIQCRVETDRDRIDDILFRRHTGTQKGIGQSTWDDRMKRNFTERSGRGSGFNVADEVEKRLSVAEMMPTGKKLPRSTMNRLLSAEPFRNRVGFSVNKGRFMLTHSEPVVLAAMSRIAHDLAQKSVVLGDIWDVDGKRAYLDRLETQGVLPTAADALPSKEGESSTIKRKEREKTPTPSPAPTPRRRENLIPRTAYSIAWAGRLQRHRAIWEELQFHLHLNDHPNAISVLFRVLLELSVENYISQTSLNTVRTTDTLPKRMLRVAEDLHSNGKIDKKYLGTIGKFPQIEQLVSADTLNRYVHSPNFAPSPEHLTAMWDTLADFIVHGLNA